jgi:hypothetical protein
MRLCDREFLIYYLEKIAALKGAKISPQVGTDGMLSFAADGELRGLLMPVENSKPIPQRIIRQSSDYE